MKAISHGRSRIRSYSVLLAVSVLTLASCGGDENKAVPSQSAAPTPAPPPTYTEKQVEKGLLTPGEISPKVKEISTVAEVLKNGGVPICSLAAAKLPGNAHITSRQFNSKESGKGDIQYTQVLALYDTPPTAMAAFEALKKKANSCPPKQNVPPKKNPRELYPLCP
ncbi:hypothetical protein [Actinomadura sp. 9N407]|uniref:hypothetical protein n=1 Tax=Actinomadura sp. 9N407 TaxID=3375154 RepID=UPI0037AA045F